MSIFSTPPRNGRSVTLSIFNPEKLFLSCQKYDPECSSRISDPDPDFFPIPDHGKKHLSRIHKSTGSRIRIRNTVKMVQSRLQIQYEQYRTVMQNCRLHNKIVTMRYQTRQKNCKVLRKTLAWMFQLGIYCKSELISNSWQKTKGTYLT